MNKEEYKLKQHIQNISLWKRLELYQEEDNSIKSNPKGYKYIKEQINKDIQAIYENIDEIKKN